MKRASSKYSLNNRLIAHLQPIFIPYNQNQQKQKNKIKRSFAATKIYKQEKMKYKAIKFK
ncbi:hypothetical protein Hanom_Chr14g01279281 [Helianthus anomalus]